VRYDAGLPAPGPGQDEQRPLDVLDRLALGGSEPFKQVIQSWFPWS